MSMIIYISDIHNTAKKRILSDSILSRSRIQIYPTFTTHIHIVIVIDIDIKHILNTAILYISIIIGIFVFSTLDIL